MFDNSNFYRRHLPHWQPENAEYFITFRLAGSLPKKEIAEIKHEREQYQRSSNRLSDVKKDRRNIHRKVFKKYEHLLDDPNSGPTYLSQPKIANIVKEAIHYRDQKEYDLFAYCIMSNHVHLVFKHLGKSDNDSSKNYEYPISKIMKSLKWYTARESNKVLNRTGHSFWFQESYDHVIRDEEERERIIRYTLQNPVKAGLVTNWQDWPNSWCKKSFF